MANEQKFLDSITGVPALWSRIKEFFALKNEVPTIIKTDSRSSYKNNDSNYTYSTKATYDLIDDVVTDKLSEVENGTY